MKPMIAALIAALGLTIPAPGIADPIEGWWQSPFNTRGAPNVWMQVEPWGKIFAGTLRQLPANVNPNRWIDPIEHRYPDLEPGDAFPIFARITPKEGGHYAAEIWTGTTWADTTLFLKGDTLTFEGCATADRICRKNSWDRAR